MDRDARDAKAIADYERDLETDRAKQQAEAREADRYIKMEEGRRRADIKAGLRYDRDCDANKENTE